MGRTSDKLKQLCQVLSGKENLLIVLQDFPDPDGKANRDMSRMIAGKGTGGGHNSMAGGQVPLEGLSAEATERLKNSIVAKFLKLFAISSAKCTPLIAE